VTWAHLVETWAGPGSTAALLAATVWLILTGRLIPRSTHRAILDVERRRGDALEQAVATEQRRADRLGEQLDALIAATGRGS